MNNSAVQFSSDEKLTGTVFKLIGAGFMVLMGAGIMTALYQGNATLAFTLLPFVIAGAVFYGVGHYHSKKFSILGLTPLTLTQGYGVVGGQISGKIDIGLPEFNRINTLKLRCLKRDYSNKSTNIKEIYSDDITPNIVHLEHSTEIHFEFSIPEDARPTSRINGNTTDFAWEVSFLYVYNMSNITRTWKVIIKA
jgi:hypothetical protein